jgi:hypothetical protein
MRAQLTPSSQSRYVIPKILRLVSKALFFFWLGVFVVEAWIFDINPGQAKVAGTGFSISFYEYITLFDLVRFFWAGLLVLAVAAALFALSRYEFIPLAIAGFYFAFNYQIISSFQLMHYYQNTYACHEVLSSTKTYTVYVCPLTSMVNGHPNIPLQGNVLALVALVISLVFFGVWRMLSVGIIFGLIEILLVTSAVILSFEAGIYYFQPHWFLQKVTDYESLLHLGEITNEDLLFISALSFAFTFAARFYLGHRRKRLGNREQVKVASELAKATR